MSAPDFTVDVFQNEYLPDGACEVNAIVTVSSAGSAADQPAAAASAAEIIIIDCSASMGQPLAKMDQAREATGAAIDAIRDGVAFAVVAGNWRARSSSEGLAAGWLAAMAGSPQSGLAQVA